MWNTAFQAHVFDKLWPEIEVNYTHWEQGTNAGKSQTVITTGLVVGRYELIDRVKFVIGFAYQEARKLVQNLQQQLDHNCARAILAGRADPRHSGGGVLGPRSNTPSSARIHAR